MAEINTIKSRPKKISISATLTSPRIISQKGLSVQNATHSSTSRKSKSIESRSVEIKSNPDKSLLICDEKKTLDSPKTMHTEKKPGLNQSDRTMSDLALGSVSPSKPHSLIPIPSRYQTKLPLSGRRGTTSPVKTSSIVNSARESRKSTPKLTKSNNSGSKSQSPSRSPFQAGFKPKGFPDKQISPTSKFSGSKDCKVEKVKRGGPSGKCCNKSPSKNPTNSTDNELDCRTSYTTITLSSPKGFTPAGSPIGGTKDLYSACSGDVSNSEAVYDSPKGKDSSDCEFTPKSSISLTSFDGENSMEYSEIYPVNNTEGISKLNLSRLDLKDCEYQIASSVEDSTRSTSAEKTLYTESDTSLTLERPRTQQTTIRTLSGDELVLPSSMEFDIENELSSTSALKIEDEVIEELLRETEDDTFVKTFSAVVIPGDSKNEAADKEEDGTNEYVRGGDKDFGDLQMVPHKKQKSKSGLGESEQTRTDLRLREMELLTDVSYRQSVYHPTVLRRQTRETKEDCSRLRSKSIDDRSHFPSNNFEKEDSVRSKNTSFKKNHSQIFVSNRDVNIAPLRPWFEKFPPEEKQIYDRIHQLQNSDYVLKEIKRERSKRERITGAVLRLTAKVIHLLAILNLWPGDNCRLLTSHNIEYER